MLLYKARQRIAAVYMKAMDDPARFPGVIVDETYRRIMASGLFRSSRINNSPPSPAPYISAGFRIGFRGMVSSDDKCANQLK